jgi:hypothetical protein
MPRTDRSTHHTFGTANQNNKDYNCNYFDVHNTKNCPFTLGSETVRMLSVKIFIIVIMAAEWFRVLYFVIIMFWQVDVPFVAWRTIYNATAQKHKHH